MTLRNFDYLAKAFAGLSHPLRVEILEMTQASSEAIVPTLVSEILEVSLSTASHNLKALHQAGWLHRNRSGRYTFYTLNENLLKDVKEYF